MKRRTRAQPMLFAVRITVEHLPMRRKVFGYEVLELMSANGMVA